MELGMIELIISVFQEIGLHPPSPLQSFSFLAFEGTHQLTQHYKSKFIFTNFPVHPTKKLIVFIPLCLSFLSIWEVFFFLTSPFTISLLSHLFHKNLLEYCWSYILNFCSTYPLNHVI